MNDRRIPTIQTPEDEYPAPALGSETVNPAPETEFSTPDPSQEFDQTSGITEETTERGFKRLRKIRKLMYGAAAIALGFVLLSPDHSEEPDAVPTEATATAAIAATAEPLAPTPAGETAAAVPVTPVPTPVSTDTPAPEPVVKEPEAEALFFSFSSEYHAWVILSNTETVQSVTAELREKNLDETVESYTWEKGDPAIEAGVLRIPVLDSSSLYFSHMDYYSNNRLEPELEMEVTVRYALPDSGEEETIDLKVQPAYEEGVYARYWGSGSFAREEGYPDSFEVGTYDKSESWRFVVGRPELVTEPGIFSVSVEYGGRNVTEEECRTVVKEPDQTLLELGFESEPNTVLLIPRPDWMPDSGTLTLKITQYLEHYGCTLTKTLKIDYSGQIDDAVYGTVVDTEIGGMEGRGR